jgi:hypothetical protein
MQRQVNRGVITVGFVYPYLWTTWQSRAVRRYHYDVITVIVRRACPGILLAAPLSWRTGAWPASLALCALHTLCLW